MRTVSARRKITLFVANPIKRLRSTLLVRSPRVRTDPRPLPLSRVSKVPSGNCRTPYTTGGDAAALFSASVGASATGHRHV